jgi:hypothetical protein
MSESALRDEAVVDPLARHPKTMIFQHSLCISGLEVAVFKFDKDQRSLMPDRVSSSENTHQKEYGNG